MEKFFPEVRRNTMVTGFFRWIDRCGKPEFVGITRAEDVPFSKDRKIDVTRDINLGEGLPYTRVTHVSIATRLVGNAELTITERPLRAAEQQVVTQRGMP